MSGYGSKDGGFEVVAVFETDEKLMVQKLFEIVEKLNVCIEIDAPMVVKGIDADEVGGEGVFSGGNGLPEPQTTYAVCF